MASGRIVFHVDMDAFYASVEERDDPRLKGRPLVVGADPRGGRGRGVVCTANYAARAFGIRSAMPISTAWRLAPHANFIPPDFERYSEASQSVMTILERYADVLEVVGMDEAYLDVTERCRDARGGPDWDLAQSLARSLQAAIQRELGLSASVGIAPGKVYAKIASDHRKPHGVTRILPADLVSFLHPLPVRRLHGCGPKTAALLRDEGYSLVGDLAAATPRHLEERLGSHGLWLQRIASGDDPRPVVADHGPRKSRGNETTFMRDERRPAHVQEVARDLLEEMLERHGRRDRRAFSTVTVKLRYSDFTTLTRAYTSPVPFDLADGDAGERAAGWVASLLRPLLDGRAVRLVGVRLSGFIEPTGQRGLAMFGLALSGATYGHVAGSPASSVWSCASSSSASSASSSSSASLSLASASLLASASSASASLLSLASASSLFASASSASAVLSAWSAASASSASLSASMSASLSSLPSSASSTPAYTSTARERTGSRRRTVRPLGAFDPGGLRQGGLRMETTA